MDSVNNTTQDYTASKCYSQEAVYISDYYRTQRSKWNLKTSKSFKEQVLLFFLEALDHKFEYIIGNPWA